jgi:hypothetical protein
MKLPFPVFSLINRASYPGLNIRAAKPGPAKRLCARVGGQFFPNKRIEMNEQVYSLLMTFRKNIVRENRRTLGN